MQQLPLPVRLRASSVFASFFGGPNADVVSCLQQRRFDISPVVFLYGAVATGKTHLLQAMCAQASLQTHRVNYLSVNDLLIYGPELLSNSTQCEILCIDDVDALLVDAEWNRALFTAYRDIEEHQGKLILSAQQPPAMYKFPLRDLASRILAGTVLRLQLLNDEEQLHALQLHALQRGLELPDESGNYLLRRLPRDMTSLCTLLDELDIASLAAQRRLTVPFIKQVLDANNNNFR